MAKKKIDMREDSKKKTATSDKIKELEDRISHTKYNKKTQHAIGLYKAQLARLKEKEVARSSKGKKGEGYSVRKSGDATVIMLGFPSVGKSTLLNALTNANSPVGSYAFTTLDVIPGSLEHKHAKIQILDVPGVVMGAAVGKGRGKEVLSVIRNADLVMILVDVFHPEQYDILKKEVYMVNVRLNQKKPDVRIKKTARNGIRIGKTVRLPDLTDEMIRSILKEFKISNAEVLIRTKINADQFIDVIEGNKAYLPSLVVVNKIDMATPKLIERVRKKIKPDIMISADEGKNLEKLKDKLYDKLELIRIFLKEIGNPPDMKEPLIIFKGCRIEDVCVKLHRDFSDKFKFARVWGKSVKFGGQKVLNKKLVLHDKDIVELHLR